jgi:uncharacterized membrane protein YphA (DoxX/SURF4 family)
MKRIRLVWFCLIWLLGVSPWIVSGHVKWFTEWSFADAPRGLGELLTPLTVGLLLFTMVALALAVFIDTTLQQQGWYQRIIAWFEVRRAVAPLALRIGLGMTFILAWQADTLLSPDLNVADQPILGWAQFALALLLIFPQTTPLAGLGTLALYVLGVAQFGAFYMLDYFIFVGVAVYLMVYGLRNARLRALRIPALYFSVGFSLFWVGIEKLVYPQWGLAILAERPVLTLGFEPSFFLTGAAFVELALGYLFIIGLLERPMAIVVTLVFFLTTLIFGKVEVIGHTIIHAALIVFLLEGTRTRVFLAPIRWVSGLRGRVGFAAVNFAVVLIVLIVPYVAMATSVHNAATSVVFRPLMRALWG